MITIGWAAYSHGKVRTVDWLIGIVIILILLAVALGVVHVIMSIMS